MLSEILNAFGGSGAALVCLWFMLSHPHEGWTNSLDLAALYFWCVLKLLRKNGD